ncbi:MAG: hypothetical protein QXP81_09965 [Nitrososphaerota archaeon]
MASYRSFRRRNAGAMESLTVVILAVAAIVIAAMVWAFLSSSVGMQQTSADFIVTTAEVRQMSTGQCRVYLNLKNNGGQSFVRLDVELVGPGGSSWSQTGVTVNLPPGQHFSYFATPGCPARWSAGTLLLLRVTLTTSSNVQVSKNVNVIVQYGA